MGYWNQNEQGVSFADAANGTEMLWGDSPADSIGDALIDIRGAFLNDVGRLPTNAEIRAGLEFSLSLYDEDGTYRG